MRAELFHVDGQADGLKISRN